MILVGGFFALRDVATQEAERDPRERGDLEGRLVATALEDGVLTGGGWSARKLDRVSD